MKVDINYFNSACAVCGKIGSAHSVACDRLREMPFKNDEGVKVGNIMKCDKCSWPEIIVKKVDS